MVCIVTALAWFALGSAKIWKKASTIILTALLFLLGYASAIELLSRPTPIDMEWDYTNLNEVDVLASKVVENDGVYLWLSLPGESAPRYYKVNWDLDTALSLQESTKLAIKNDTGVVMNNPFRHTKDDEEYKKQFKISPPAHPLTKERRSLYSPNN